MGRALTVEGARDPVELRAEVEAAARGEWTQAEHPTLTNTTHESYLPSEPPPVDPVNDPYADVTEDPWPVASNVAHGHTLPPSDEGKRADSAGKAKPSQAALLVELEIVPIAEVVAQVDAAGSPQFLFRPVWAVDAYGVIAAEDKAGKSWMMLDAAVSVASGTAWLSHFEVDCPGPVLLFAGEGGERKLVRRLRAVCASRRLILESLPIRVCLRVPHLTRESHVRRVAAELGAQPARLVIVDPLYLAARGARGSDLYEMGAHLEAIQHVVQNAGAALVISHHWNKTGQGKGAKRMSGVGPGAWGRVLASGDVEQRSTDPDGASNVVVAWDFIGDEIPETTVRIRRRVWVDDPDDLGSAMHYDVQVLDPSTEPPEPELEGLSPAQRRIALILGASDGPMWVSDVQEATAHDGQGSPLKVRTVQLALAELVAAGLADEADEHSPRGAKAYLASSELQRVSARIIKGLRRACTDIDTNSFDPKTLL